MHDNKDVLASPFCGFFFWRDRFGPSSDEFFATIYLGNYFSSIRKAAI